MRLRIVGIALIVLFVANTIYTAPQPVRASRGMVTSQNLIASKIGANVLKKGGSAIDAAVSMAFALAVTHPTAGNIGGGGFIVYRAASGDATAYDFREVAPLRSSPTMFLKDGEYDFTQHHLSYLSIGVPGTVAGLYLAWEEHGKLPWESLVKPAIVLARDGFEVSVGVSRSLKAVLPRMEQYPASVQQFSKNGIPYEAGEILKQLDLAGTLERIAREGPAGFYEGETARLIEMEMQKNGGLITKNDLRDYKPKTLEPVRGTYRGYEVISMPPISSGGTVLIEMLNILEGYDLASFGFGSAQAVHLSAEAMRRAYADRARYLGDPDFNPTMPITRLTSKEYAAEIRETIDPTKASISTPNSFEWSGESMETTHLSVVDEQRNAVSLTYTLEYGYGSRIVVPGAGFLLNNEMGDFNGAPGLTTADGLIGTTPNLAAPGKRMLSSMTPTILTKDEQLFMVTGTPGGRTIINTVLQTILNVVDFKMNIQAAVDAGRFHHQWLPDHIRYERHGLSPDTLSLLKERGHHLREVGSQGNVQAILYDHESDILEGASDRRRPDGGAIGF